MATREFRQQLSELQAMVRAYFESGIQPVTYNVDGFVNQDVALYRQYEDIQEKFEALAKLFDKDRKDHGSPHVARSEEYLRQVGLCNRGKWSPKEEDIKAGSETEATQD